MIEFRGHTRPVVALAYAPDGRTLASASIDGTARLWDAISGRELARFQSTADAAHAVAFAGDGAELAVGYSGRHGLAQRWRLPSGQKVDEWLADRQGVRAVAYRPHGRELAVGGFAAWVSVWDLGAPLADFRSFLTLTNSCVNGLAFAPDGLAVAAITSKPAHLRLWRTDSRRLVKKYQFSVTWGYAIAFAPDGASVACGLDDETALWPVAPDKTAPYRWPAHAGAVLGVAFRPDGSGLLTCGADGLVKSWDPAGNLRRSYDWRVGELCSLAVAPDGLTAAVGGAESIAVWDLE